MNFDKFFKLISYAVVFCGFLTLWVSGSFGIIFTFIFLAGLVTAWYLEDSNWQISERLGTGLIFVVVPLFYIGWKYQFFGLTSNETIIAGILSRLILGLSGIKLIQKKADRDWLFLYLMAFFEVLLAAALSISPLYLGALILYLLVSVLAIIGFDLRKSARSVNSGRDNDHFRSSESLQQTPIRKLPAVSIILLFLIVGFAVPMFFMLPRVGGAGFGGNQGGVTGLTGFSNNVRLGEIGRIQQSDELVMRVGVEGDEGNIRGGIRWRGVTLDTFDNQSWSKKSPQINIVKIENDAFRLEYAVNKRPSATQTIYLEPLDTNVLFGLSRLLAIQGNFQTIEKDGYGSITANRRALERISYKVVSERWQPTIETLQGDNGNYQPTDSNYLQIPAKFDERFAQLAALITKNKKTRYEKVKAVEEFLQTQFGYTLELKAGGEQPLADFLFNVKEGHCEYFASAMVMLLRTQGIAARIVNGFQHGEFNDASGLFVVRQKDAHSWVEVYFPKEKAWITFDPTPSAGQNLSSSPGGMFSFVGKYLDALEAFWIQYFVSFDNQEQRSLFRSMKNGFVDYQAKMTGWLNEYQSKIQDWWTEVRGDKGFQTSARAIAYGAAYVFGFIALFLALRWLYRRVKRSEFWRRIFVWWTRKKQKSIVEFYERLERVLAKNGLQRQTHQTPLEFAFASGMPEAVSITEKYNRVRFGEKNLSNNEAREIENWLNDLENKQQKP